MKFDPDYAIFGTLGGEISDDSDIGGAKISYVNRASVSLFKDFSGVSIADVIREIADSEVEGEVYVDRLIKKGVLAFEGKLAGKFVKFHSRIVDREQPGCRRVQAAIMDITNSVTLKRMLYDTSEALKRAAMAADENTGQHVIRINHYSGTLAGLGGFGLSYQADISRFAQLHDIGKIRVAEVIRLERKLTAEEFDLVKRHAIFGAEMVENLEGLEMAYNIALDHHEKWDGSGYPNGKQRRDISPEGRIVAIADVFDALVSARAYKPAFSYKKAQEIITEGDGRTAPDHFDPELLHLFLDNYDDFVDIHKELT